MAGWYFAQGGRREAAPRHGMRAARVEMTARRRVERRGNLALEGGEFLVSLIEPRHLGEQRLRVGVVGVGEEIVGRRLLDDAAEIHDGHAVRDMLDDAETGADEGE